MIQLPAGYHHRAATDDDAAAIWRLRAACEEELYGRAGTALSAIQADLRRPTLELANDTVVVYDRRGGLAGWAWIHLGKRAQVDVAPDHRGRGLGSALADWTEARARHLGSDWFSQTVDDEDKVGTDLVCSRGYEVLAINWLLELPLPTEPEVPVVEGVTFRPYQPGDGPAVHQLVEDAFAGFQPRRKPYEEWARLTVERADFAPAVSRLGFAGDDLVGAVLALDGTGDEGYVEQVAVRADQRGRGIARALLAATGAEYHRRGATSYVLWTHSGTGALGMYERLGLRVKRSTTVHRRTL